MLPLIRVNDKVEPAEVRWQFEEMQRRGVHGAFLLPEGLGGSFIEGSGHALRLPLAGVLG